MERFFQIAAVILAGIAAYFLWTGNGDGAFLSAVLGAVSFFLSVRFQIKGRLEDSAAVENEAFIEPEQLSGALDPAEPLIDGRRTTNDEQKANL